MYNTCKPNCLPSLRYVSFQFAYKYGDLKFLLPIHTIHNSVLHIVGLRIHWYVKCMNVPVKLLAPLLEKFLRAPLDVGGGGWWLSHAIGVSLCSLGFRCQIPWEVECWLATDLDAITTKHSSLSVRVSALVPLCVCPCPSHSRPPSPEI